MTSEPTLPLLGSIWTYRQLDQAIQDYADEGPFPFSFAIVDLDLSDENAPAPETLTLRCTEPARPKCAFKVVVNRVPGDKASLWRVDTVVENHTHWQSVFADPGRRQEAIELSERHHDSPRRRHAHATAPDSSDDNDHPAKPLLWAPAKQHASTSATSRSGRKRPYKLKQRALPAILSIEEWQTRTARELTPHPPSPPLAAQQGSSRDLEEIAKDVFAPNGKPRPAPLLLAPVPASKLISPSFGTSQFHQEVHLDPSHPFSARLPSPHRLDGAMDKGKGRAEDAMNIDLSPRTTLLNAVAKIPPVPPEPDTPLVAVRPGIELIVGEREETVDDNAGVPPVPTVGSKWASRDAFKEACQRHAEAIKPPFGFTTPTSSTTGAIKFIIYACRHNRKGGGGCPYLMRCQAVDPSRADSEWVVTDGCYRHANHQVPSPPLRLGWGLSKPNGTEKRTAEALSGISANAQPAAKRQRASTPPLDRRQPLDTFLPALHPALSSATCVTALKAVGIDGTETLSSLTTHELAVILTSCGKSLSALQRSVLANRLAKQLDDHPRVGNRPGRKARTVHGALQACHANMFPKEGDGSVVARLIEEAGVPDSETLRSLEPEELVEVLEALPAMSVVQRVVIVNRWVRNGFTEAQGPSYGAPGENWGS